MQSKKKNFSFKNRRLLPALSHKKLTFYTKREAGRVWGPASLHLSNAVYRSMVRISVTAPYSAGSTCISVSAARTPAVFRPRVTAS